MRNEAIIFILATVLSVAVVSNGCKKEPCRATVDGYVLNYTDSTAVPNAAVLVLLWDGSSQHDTILLLTAKCNSK